ncbi:hypothetical protein F5Y17DRAFT_413654 [Xylariaceae sp. FL0594]|nr:hypothetical protein F5Y17DRAFT_413654 [Xylariaceae sp. FL0594]
MLLPSPFRFKIYGFVLSVGPGASDLACSCKLPHSYMAMCEARTHGGTPVPPVPPAYLTARFCNFNVVIKVGSLEPAYLDS